MGKYQSAGLKRYAAHEERMDLCVTIARTLANVLLYYRLFETSLFIRQGTFYKCSGRVLINIGISFNRTYGENKKKRRIKRIKHSLFYQKSLS